MNYFIIVFKNTHDAIAGEKTLLEKGFVFRIMPTPTVITQSCGICIRIEDEKQVNQIIDSNIIIFKGIYVKEGSTFKVIAE